jgi:hypothetical protein
MKINKRVTLSGLVAFALVVCAVLAGIAGAPVARASDPAPASVSNYRQATIQSTSRLTTAVTGTAYLWAGFGVADCYSTFVNAAGTQTVTNKLQHSADGTNWVDLVSFAAASTAGTTFTRTAVYGQYLRNVPTLGTTNGVTFSVVCTLKNNGG